MTGWHGGKGSSRARLRGRSLSHFWRSAHFRGWVLSCLRCMRSFEKILGLGSFCAGDLDWLFLNVFLLAQKKNVRLVLGGLGVRSASRTRMAGFWASWVHWWSKPDIPGLPHKSLFNWGTPARAAHSLEGVRGFEVPSWRALAAGLCPPDPEEFQRIEQEHRETLFRVMAELERALFRFQGGSGVGASLYLSDLSSHSHRPHSVFCCCGRLRLPLPCAFPLVWAVESAVARICREVGARVTTNVLVRGFGGTQSRRCPSFGDHGGIQFAIDTTLISEFRSLWIFGGVLKTRTPKCPRLGTRVVVWNPGGFGPPGLHTITRELHTYTFELPVFQTPPKFHEKTQTKRAKMGREREKKSAKFGAPHPSGPHPSAPTIRASPLELPWQPPPPSPRPSHTHPTRTPPGQSTTHDNSTHTKKTSKNQFFYIQLKL